MKFGELYSFIGKYIIVLNVFLFHDITKSVYGNIDFRNAFAIYLHVRCSNILEIVQFKRAN